MSFTLKNICLNRLLCGPVTGGTRVDVHELCLRVSAADLGLARSATLLSDHASISFTDAMNLLTSRAYCRPEGEMRDKCLREGLIPLKHTRAELAAAEMIAAKRGSSILDVREIAASTGSTIETAEAALFKMSENAPPPPLDRTAAGAARRRARHSAPLFREGGTYFDGSSPALRVGAPFITPPRGGR